MTLTTLHRRTHSSCRPTVFAGQLPLVQGHRGFGSRRSQCRSWSLPVFCTLKLLVHSSLSLTTRWCRAFFLRLRRLPRARCRPCQTLGAPRRCFHGTLCRLHFTGRIGLASTTVRLQHLPLNCRLHSMPFIGFFAPTALWCSSRHVCAHRCDIPTLSDLA